jgi:cobalt/nickel transport system ATP-binding protein
MNRSRPAESPDALFSKSREDAGLPIINVRGLRYRYPDGTVALDGVDFQLRAGERVAVLGANGSGKTTFVRHLNGLLRGEGSVEVCGLVIDARATASTLAAVRSRVGLVFQNSDEQLFMPTVLEDVAFGPANLGLTPEDAVARARTALEQVGLLAAAAKAPYHLSAGEKRRAAIAGVLAMQPEILVLDEPTTSLDPPGRRELLRLLHNLPQAKILVTHDAEFARALAARAVFFERGHIIADGDIGEIIERFHWSRESE